MEKTQSELKTDYEDKSKEDNTGFYMIKLLEQIEINTRK